MHQKRGKGGSKESLENLQFVLNKRNSWTISSKVKSFQSLLLKDLMVTKRSLESPFTLGQLGAYCPMHLCEATVMLSENTEEYYTVKPKLSFNIKMR